MFNLPTREMILNTKYYKELNENDILQRGDIIVDKGGQPFEIIDCWAGKKASWYQAYYSYYRKILLTKKGNRII